MSKGTTFSGPTLGFFRLKGLINALLSMHMFNYMLYYKLIKDKSPKYGRRDRQTLIPVLCHVLLPTSSLAKSDDPRCFSIHIIHE